MVYSGTSFQCVADNERGDLNGRPRQPADQGGARGCPRQTVEGEPRAPTPVVRLEEVASICEADARLVTRESRRRDPNRGRHPALGRDGLAEHPGKVLADV